MKGGGKHLSCTVMRKSLLFSTLQQSFRFRFMICAGSMKKGGGKHTPCTIRLKNGFLSAQLLSFFILIRL